MGLLRSERMKHGTLVLPSDRARSFISLIGRKANIQLLDMNEQVIHRPYRKHIQRIDEIQRKLKFLYDELEGLQRHVHIGSVECFLDNENVYTLEKVEISLEKLYQQFVKFKENNEDLVEQKNAAILEKNVVLAATAQLKPDLGDTKLNTDFESLLDNHENQIHMEEGVAQQKINEDATMTFSSVAGVIFATEQERFARTIFRITRGNTYTHFQSIPEPIQDAKTGRVVNKSVFVVYYQGSVSGFLYDKIVKICRAFDTTIFEWPKTHDAAIRRLSKLQITIDDKEKALRAYEKFLLSEVNVLLETTRSDGGSSLVEEWRMFAIKEKMIYATLNLFEGSDITLRADCWFPECEEEKIRQLLMNESNEDQVSAFLLSDRGNTKFINSPTRIRVTEFSSAFQNFVDTYGVPRYREANPALLTIISFPFLFGIMYGDIGHGACLVLFALSLIFFSNKRKGKGEGELTQMMISGRYMILLMGLFAMYAGFLYNDFFSIGLNIFGSRWKLNKNKWEPGDNFPYPFGVDPKWKGATNELAFFNSFKMKFSVIVGFVQMSVGLLLKGLNAIHFNQPLNFCFEFLPQIIFLVSLVGYMDFLIIYKWITPTNHNKPMLITTIINMCMFSSIQRQDELFHKQELIQKILVILMLVSIPLMLLAKPLIKLFLIKMKTKDEESSVLNGIDTFPDSEQPTEDMPITEYKDETPYDFGEEFIHQMIETIEFVLGTISNTASYLRLWALSLAHQQLALVFFQKTILLAFELSDNLLVMCIALFVGYAVFAVITFGVMLCMDSLECFLHALRLQWVEFQNKFYKADGYPFTPLNFKSALTDNEEY